jgi:DNA-binding NarL/FixJ family response regulator
MISVAIVEDHAGFSASLKRVLQTAADIRVAVICTSGEEAVREVPVASPDVVLMDLNLPGMNGAEATARLKELCPDLDVIMLTAYDDAESIFKALRSGACGYLLKRASAPEILAAVRDVCQGGAPMSSEIARKVVKAFNEPAPATPAKDNLSPREREILKLVAGGFSNKEIADQLGLTVDTACSYIKGIYRKLHVHSRTQAALHYRQRLT